MGTRLSMDEIAMRLRQTLQEKYKREGAELDDLLQAGQHSLTESIKKFIKKNGTREVEDILMQRKDFNGSELKRLAVSSLERDLKAMGMKPDESDELASFSSCFLAEELVLAFQQSGNSRDINGICDFLGIDKSLVKIINSPAGRFLGKIF